MAAKKHGSLKTISRDYTVLNISDIRCESYSAKNCNGEIHLLNSLARDARRSKIPEALRDVFLKIISSHHLIGIKVDYLNKFANITDEDIAEIYELAVREFELFKRLLGFPFPDRTE